MDRVKILKKWIAKSFLPVSMAIFVLIYIWWFRLTPWNPDNDCCSNFNIRFGFILLIFYFGFGMLWWVTKNITFLGKLFGLTAICFFILNSLYIKHFIPRIIEISKYNGTAYYLVSYSTWPDSPYTIYQLTKWQKHFRYDSHDVGIQGSFEIRYDEKMQLVSVVKVFPTKYERLVYSDSVPPRDYDYGYGIDVEFEGKRYYVSYQCNKDPKYPYLCETYTSVLYHCELDNTSCTPLPFQYTGDCVFGFSIERGNAPKDINVFFDIGKYPGTKTLIFVDGKHPRCYIEGCEILESSK